MTTSGIGGIHSNYGMNTGKTEDAKKPSEAKGEKVEGQRPPPPPPPKNRDTYVPSEEAQAAIATMDEVVEEEAEVTTPDSQEETTETKGMDKEAVMALKAELKANTAAFLQKMAGNITGQANASLKADGIWDAIRQGNFEITEAEQAEAQEAISEDGYWGVEQTATRIFDMAVALSGGDSGKADELMAAIEKGYEEAEKVWGGELPSITADTKTRVDELFAEWKGE